MDEQNINTYDTKRKPSGTAAGLTLICIAILLLITFAFTGKPSTKVQDFISVSVEGYDSVAEAEISFDSTAFETSASGKITYREKKVAKYADEDWWWLDELNFDDNPEDVLSDIIESSITASQTEDISNGDVITVSLSLSSEELEALGNIFRCHIKFTEIEYEVSGLEEVELYNPFEGIEVNFIGLNGAAYPEVITDEDDEILSEIVFMPGSYDGLSNGDTVEIIALYSESDIASEFGVVIYPSSKTYTVEGLPSTVYYMDEIENSGMVVLQGKAANEIGETERSLEYSGYFFLSGDDENMLFMVFKLYDDEAESYVTVKFKSLGLYDDGSVYYESTESLGESESIAEIYDDFVRGKINRYELETSFNEDLYYIVEEEDDSWSWYDDLIDEYYDEYNMDEFDELLEEYSDLYGDDLENYIDMAEEYYGDITGAIEEIFGGLFGSYE